MLARARAATSRAFARDRFHNPIVAEKTIFISGDEDENRLRIITERDEFRVGETPGVRVIYREEPALALITYEGEDIFRYGMVRLSRGENTINISVTDELMPNFTLGVAVMRGNLFLSADKDFNVIKGLEITLVPEKEAYAPGETMKLKIEKEELGKRIGKTIKEGKLWKKRKKECNDLKKLLKQRVQELEACIDKHGTLEEDTAAMVDSVMESLLEEESDESSTI